MMLMSLYKTTFVNPGNIPAEFVYLLIFIILKYFIFKKIPES